MESGLLVRKDKTELTLAELEKMYLATLSEAEREFLYPGGTTDGFSIEIWEFLEILRGQREKPEIDGWEGLRSLAVGDAIYESALTGEAIQVDEIVSGERARFQAPLDEHWQL